MAIIAVGQHMIQVDIHHTGWPEMLGISALMLSLAASYFLVKRAQARSSKEAN